MAGDNEKEEVYKTDSYCLLLNDDDETDGAKIVKQVLFKRDERGEGSLDDSAAELLGIKGDRVRCLMIPHLEKKLGYALHMYIDLQGLDHKMAHNSNATQLYLIACLPEEPPQVSPASIHGPVLLSAENFKTEEYVDLTLEEWKKIKALCRAIQPNAQFTPYEAPAPGEEVPLNDD